jgi:hypothetical protein
MVQFCTPFGIIPDITKDGSLTCRWQLASRQRLLQVSNQVLPKWHKEMEITGHEIGTEGKMTHNHPSAEP